MTDLFWDTVAAIKSDSGPFEAINNPYHALNSPFHPLRSPFHPLNSPYHALNNVFNSNRGAERAKMLQELLDEYVS